MPRTDSLRPSAGAPHGEDVDPAPASPAPLSESWSELTPDVFVLPAAVEAAQATADEGPGPWPPVVADDPADAPMATPKATAALPAVPPRGQALQALERLLRRVKTSGVRILI
jgi:hypothetical protein